MFIHYSYKVGCEYDLIATHFKSDRSYKLFTSEIHFFYSDIIYNIVLQIITPIAFRLKNLKVINAAPRTVVIKCWLIVIIIIKYNFFSDF